MMVMLPADDDYDGSILSYCSPAVNVCLSMGNRMECQMNGVGWLGSFREERRRRGPWWSSVWSRWCVLIWRERLASFLSRATFCFVEYYYVYAKCQLPGRLLPYLLSSTHRTHHLVIDNNKFLAGSKMVWILSCAKSNLTEVTRLPVRFKVVGRNKESCVCVWSAIMT